MARFLLPPNHWQTDPALTGDEAKHAAQVLRVKPGQTVTVFDGRGRRSDAEILAVSRDHIPLRFLGEPELPPAPLPAITLVQAIPKGKNMDLIVQKAVELGVASIQPLVTRNTVVQPGDKKAHKWRRTALEACKQCGQDTLPHIADPITFDAWIPEQGNPNPGLQLIASLAPGAKPFRQTLLEHPGTTAATLLIGPEGDFSPQETEAATAAGFLPVTLGDIVLRVETATLYCLSALRYQYSC